MAKLKEVRKEGREILRQSDYYMYICYRKGIEFYLSNYNNEYAVFILYKNGSLGKVLDTNHAQRFHAELKHRKKLRR